ncbi:hypothetical protein CALCODRAFT_514748 [Calocera cornea HHB12733]|uniref:Mitochondrial DNA polymerase catalytic subunit n=1 Tax=Calocera cornea HHB12733 TaxID=1353952 RepID=A0A165J6J6_9BASI|nr:hypothetical protein CALCODRAFT_514748 [Calocera cornea HHB12733]
MLTRCRPRRPPPTADALFRAQPHRRAATTVRRRTPQELATQREQQRHAPSSSTAADTADAAQPPRNAAGVQLLSPPLRAQLFPPSSAPFPPPPPHAVKRALQHLAHHALDTTAASTLPQLSFPLPQLTGRTLDEHFHRIARAAAAPSLALARAFARTHLPAPPEEWARQSGWTRYAPDGSYEPVPHLPPDETALTFDIENMPHYSSYPIIACAASAHAWYAWLSPWILGESPHPEHLIPFGPDPAGGTRVVVGHNVAYDRARVAEEYTLQGTGNKWVDTMSLHVATHGISSHQRPAWNKYKAGRKHARTRAVESVEAVRGMIGEFQRELAALDAAQGEGEQVGVDVDVDVDDGQGEAAGNKVPLDRDKKRRELESSIAQLEAGLAGLLAEQSEGLGLFSEDLAEALDALDGDGAGAGSRFGSGSGSSAGKRWERMTSGNSLVDVARLHCGIHVEKDARDELLTFSREDISADLATYITYCASDVATTHAVFRVVLPSFLETCPSPVTWAGVMTMGSAFLPVDQEWERYIARAEGKYTELESGVKRNLQLLAEEARAGGWERARHDQWLSQLDWADKKPRRPRGGGGGKPLRDAAVPDAKSGKVKEVAALGEGVPAWYWEFTERPPLHELNIRRFLPLLLKLGHAGKPLVHSATLGWLCEAPFTDPPLEAPGASAPGGKSYYKLGKATAHKVAAKRFRGLESAGKNLWMRLADGERGADVEALVLECAERLREDGVRAGFADEVGEGEGEARGTTRAPDAWEQQLDWTLVTPRPASASAEGETWPKWYWDLNAAKPGEMPKLDVTARSRAAPLLLKLRWQGFPLFYSRQHGWMYRVPPASARAHQTRQTAQAFIHEDDAPLARDVDAGFVFYKLPHKDGEEMNVGNPLSKTFVAFASDGILTADTEQGEEAQRCAADALDMNAQCSYWISARDRVMKQMVVWQGSAQAPDLGFPAENTPGAKRGIILPQVVTMGTVTRRAIEKTWLTASNAKKNRVGSELKAMVRAPDGYSIVGADVDSEELWISSVMGDAQFGMHGATAIGWMTLEGTKANGTDLHSKTASILGISRDAAKVFNYSRIYGAGLKHAQLLMLQSNPKLLLDDAKTLVEKLYASTKGQTTRKDRFFNRKFWYGGTESFLFNKLEEIALSDKPLTPALGCGVTRALTKEYLGLSEYLPSRINWVVQSSGVDYLHLLIVGMQYLIDRYKISARYLISVHDELRYLVRDEDRYRAALALQIANLWTRSLFSFKLGMDDLPQGVAFFSAVDVDKYLRKETDMTCITPSQTEALPPGESLNIEQVIKATNGGSLQPEGTVVEEGVEEVGDLEGYVEPDCMIHRSRSPAWLRAQATNELSEIRMLWKAEEEKSGVVTPPSPPAKASKRKTTPAEQKPKREQRRVPKQSAGTARIIHVHTSPVTLESWAEQQANAMLPRM